MFKTIGTLFSMGSKAIKATTSAMDSATESINNLTNSIQIKTVLKNLAHQVFKQEISYHKAKEIVRNNYGSESLSSFENELDYFREIVYSLTLYDVFGLTENKAILPMEQAREELTNKLGTINESLFQACLKEKRERAIRICGENNRFFLANLSDNELAKKVKQKIEHTNKILKSLDNVFK